MSFACDCLNIIIEANGGEEGDNENINAVDDSFLKDKIKLSSPKITKKLNNLIQSKQRGQWTVECCVVCGQEVYASLKNNDTIFVSNMLKTDNERIAIKKESPNFSPFFQIIINHSELGPDYTSDSAFDFVKKLPSELNQWLEKQAALTEKRIQMYSDRQYKDLERLKKHLCQDNEVLSRKKRAFTQPLEMKKSDVADTKKSSIVNVPKKDSISLSNAVRPEIYESDEIFFLDDVDVKKANISFYVESVVADVKDEVSDCEVADEAPISRSLPVPVPQFMAGRDISNQQTPDEHPADIAASIEALARSVHGNNIFGELPPPRYNTTKF